MAPIAGGSAIKDAVERRSFPDATYGPNARESVSGWRRSLSCSGRSGASDRRLGQAHGLLRVDLEVHVVARVPERRVDVVANLAEGVALPQAEDRRLIRARIDPSFAVRAAWSFHASRRRQSSSCSAAKTLAATRDETRRQNALYRIGESSAITRAGRRVGPRPPHARRSPRGTPALRARLPRDHRAARTRWPSCRRKAPRTPRSPDA
jgi:hypothetical protein